MLHILRHSPHAETRFASCLRAISADQSLLLIEDAAYALLPGTSSRNALEYLPGNVQLYTLESDLLARGIALDDVSARIQLIDYSMMVALCTEHSKVVSW
ncbi:DsrH family protein [Pseudomonas saudimassiliensis]|uniref:DsrH family protein n=1 Tax=Pseudomonas saudimassiliensis TaxID=1461581 RepID=A0A078MFQ0_9PSED|nr:sulfurtransferase complex subunit TusB [Pseudomonas saudimassiliensis]CEA05115.1 DsrH family protein [Pseudomonas saudimassiliensis]CEF26956.1 DsrH family protein [Pseudomonas saudimassiliensis]